VLLTGTQAAPFFEDAARRIIRRDAPVDLTVVPVENRFLGATVTVAGLLSGTDLARALREDAPEAGLYLLPAEAFNADGLTLDGMTVDDIARRAGRSPVEASGDLVRSLIEHAGGGESQ
jgi:NifB/MoaA-like Fe-S oxidoreductase